MNYAPFIAQLITGGVVGLKSTRDCFASLAAGTTKAQLCADITYINTDCFSICIIKIGRNSRSVVSWLWGTNGRQVVDGD
jgi:hypothetical protein